MIGRVLAIDPGPVQSGWVIWDGETVVGCGVLGNADMLKLIRGDGRGIVSSMAIEMIASYGMAVGREVFDTCVWVGRFMQAWFAPDAVMLVYRKDVKSYLCGSMKAKDANIRQALIDKIGGKGTKAAPGPTYAVKSHAWPALAVAVTAMHLMQRQGDRPAVWHAEVTT